MLTGSTPLQSISSSRICTALDSLRSAATISRWLLLVVITLIRASGMPPSTCMVFMLYRARDEPLPIELTRLARFLASTSSISSMNDGSVPHCRTMTCRAMSVDPCRSSCRARALGGPKARAAACSAAVLPMPDFVL